MGAVFTPVIRVQQADFDIAAEQEALEARIRRETLADIGAIVSFTGLCRSENGRLAALELEHYPAMAEAEIGRVAEEAASRWPLMGVTILHRFGRIAAGEKIVLVITASGHRQAAFNAAAFLMDYLKARAPFWKKEIPANAGEGQWVEARAEDDLATRRWEE